MWIEFLKTGDHTDSCGRKHGFSPERLDEIANINNELLASTSNHLIPLTKGHKISGDPAYGWIKEIKRKGGRLIARLDEVSNDILQQIAAGSFQNVSVSLDGNKIKHLALLGADNPSVQGLEPFKYLGKSDFEASEMSKSEIVVTDENNDNSNLLLDEIEKLKMENKNYLIQLSEFEKQNRISGFKEFIMNLNESGYNSVNTSNDVDSAVDLLEVAYLYDKNTENNGVMLEKMKSFFKGNKSNVQLTEFAVKMPDNNIVSKFESKNVDPERLRKHLEILEFMQNNPNLTYEQALNNLY